MSGSDLASWLIVTGFWALVIGFIGGCWYQFKLDKIGNRTEFWHDQWKLESERNADLFSKWLKADAEAFGLRADNLAGRLDKIKSDLTDTADPYSG